MNRFFAIILVLCLLVGSARAQNQPQTQYVNTQDLPAPRSGSTSLSNGDKVTADRSGTTYGLIASFGGTCPSNQFVSSINLQGVPACAQPTFSGFTGVLPIVNGGTGTSTPGLIGGANVSVTGSWPNQTINASGGGSPATPVNGIQFNLASAFAASANLEWLNSLNTLAVIGSVGIGTSAPISSLDLSKETDALAMPIGTTGQRPGSPISGQMRLNSSIPTLEAYYNSRWNAINPSTALSITTFPNVVCNGSGNDIPGIQAALVSNPTATFDFGNANCTGTGPLKLTDTTHSFTGNLIGHGATLTCTNNGSSSDTDANMQNCIQAYPQTNGSGGDVSGYPGIISGINVIGPAHGAGVHFGNSLGAQFVNGGTASNRYGVATDASIDVKISSNNLTNSVNAVVGLIYSQNSNIYYGSSPATTYWNDNPQITGNIMSGNTAGGLAVILDDGSNAEGIRNISGNSFDNGSNSDIQYFYVGRKGNPNITNNWVENLNYPVRILAPNANEGGSTTLLPGVTAAEPTGTYQIGNIPDGFSYFATLQNNQTVNAINDFNVSGVVGGGGTFVCGNLSQNMSGYHLVSSQSGAQAIIDCGDALVNNTGSYKNLTYNQYLSLPSLIGMTGNGVGGITIGSSLAINSTLNNPVTITSSNTIATNIVLQNTSSGAHQFAIADNGSASSADGYLSFFDFTESSTPFGIFGGSTGTAGVKAVVTSTGLFGFSNNSNTALGTTDTGISRLSTNSLALGNGSQGDFSGTVAVGSVGIGSSVPRAAMDVSQNTGSIILPTGTLSQRPSTGINGMIRYNTSTPSIEAYANNVWGSLGSGGSAGTVTTVSVATANGFSGTVANATTTPAITIVAGAITPTSVNGLTITSSTGTLTIANLKTLTANNSLTLSGTDGSSVAFGTGGTVAYTANNLSVFASTTSAQLAGVLSDETGTNLAVFNTAPTFATNITDPVVIGGTTASSSLTLQSTSGVGTTDSILFKVGNAGANLAGLFNTNGALGIGTSAVSGNAGAVTEQVNGKLLVTGGTNCDGDSSAFGICLISNATLSGFKASFIDAIEANVSPRPLAIQGIGGGQLDIGAHNWLANTLLTVSGNMAFNDTVAPTATSCGSGNMASDSTSNHFRVTGITAATSCTITFATSPNRSFPYIPSCGANGSVAGIVGTPTSVSSTAVTFTMTALTGTLYGWCF